MRRRAVAWAAFILALLGGADSVLFAEEHLPKEHPLAGMWLVEDKTTALVFYDCGEVLCGRMEWFADPKVGESHDTRNPDPALRVRSRCGLTVVTGLREDIPFDTTPSWSGGTFYDPVDGHTYGALMYIGEENVLRFRVYLKLPILGLTQTWTRFTEPREKCR